MTRRFLPVVLYAHPFELAFGLILTLIGIRQAGALGAQPVGFDVPGYVDAAVVVGSILGGVSILVGLAGRTKALPRAIEKAGLYLVAGVFTAYAVALVALPGFAGTVTAVIELVIGVACFLRARAIGLTERVILEQLRRHNTGHADPDAIRDLVDGRPPREAYRIPRRRR